MFKNVITGYFSTFKVIQGHILGLMSSEGQRNSAKLVSAKTHDRIQTDQNHE